MGIFDRLFGGRKDRPPEIPTGSGSASSLEQLLSRHLSRMRDQHVSAAGFRTMKPRWDRLLSPEIAAYTMEAISQELGKSAVDHLHHYQGRRFPGVYVAVSTIPAADPAEAKGYFRSGYTGLLDVLLNESDFFGTGDVDIAHWVFCCDGTVQGVHLTYLPSANSMRTSKQIAVMAHDLMTPAERAQAGLIWNK